MSSQPTDTSWQLRFDRLTVADVIPMDPITVGVDATVEAAETLLVAYRVSGLPVVDGAGQLVGVLPSWKRSWLAGEEGFEPSVS